MTDAKMDPMPMEGEMNDDLAAIAEGGHGPYATQVNLHYFFTAMFMATKYGLRTFRYESATDAYDAWEDSYGGAADSTNYWKISE